MALTINVPDTLRKSVEGASNGKNTVLYTAKGQPCYMYVLQRADLAAAATALGLANHPAFTVGGVLKSELLIAQHLGASLNGEMVSQPGQRPANTITHDAAISLARANGAGWHLMTNVEWGALAHWCKLNGFLPRGNTDYGRSSDVATERGVDDVTGRLALAAGTATTWTRTGSGPASWRHDNTPFGIADLNGNVWEWAPGMRLNNGEIQILADNDAAAWNGTTGADLSATSAAWKAIDGATGALVAPGSVGTVTYAATGTGNYALVCGSGAAFESMTNPGVTPVSAAALNVLKAHGLFPVGTGLGGDGFWATLTGEMVPIRGGTWVSGALAGVFAVNLFYARSVSSPAIGARPAFVL